MLLFVSIVSDFSRCSTCIDYICKISSNNYKILKIIPFYIACKGIGSHQAGAVAGAGVGRCKYPVCHRGRGTAAHKSRGLSFSELC